MIKESAELGYLRQRRFPIGYDHRDATVKGLDMVQDLLPVESA